MFQPFRFPVFKLSEETSPVRTLVIVPGDGGFPEALLDAINGETKTKARSITTAAVAKDVRVPEILLSALSKPLNIPTEYTN